MMGHPAEWLGGLNPACVGPWSYIMSLLLPSLCAAKQKFPEMCIAVFSESGNNPAAELFPHLYHKRKIQEQSFASFRFTQDHVFHDAEELLGHWRDCM